MVPCMTSSRSLPRALTTLSAAVAALAVMAAPALAAKRPSQLCAEHSFTQPFTAFKDQNLYTLAPGGAFDDPTGGGWELSGGAQIVQATQPDGTEAGVLDLPTGAQAVSPVLCVTSDYPTARAWVRNVTGGGGVDFAVSYLVNGEWTKPKNTGQFHGEKQGWTPSTPMNLQPRAGLGFQQVRISFLAGGKGSRFQVNDFWVDPHMKA
jgi:hypothetical protein